MIGSIIGAGLSLAGSIYSGIKSAQEKKKYDNALLESQKEAKADKTYYAGLTPEQSQDYVKSVNDAKNIYQDYIASTEGKDAVMGTDSSAERNAALKASGSTIATAAVNAQNRIDTQRNQAQERLDNLNQEQRNAYLAQSAQNAQAGSEALKTGAGLFTSDAQSKLATGKGLFENLFSKS